MHADVVFVGEQPGVCEDTEGHPFVGPGGKLLDKALEEVEIDRSQVYVTNVVKHFKWKPLKPASPCANRLRHRRTRRLRLPKRPPARPASARA
jgi:uracil-DNA glycosylase family 4